LGTGFTSQVGRLAARPSLLFEAIRAFFGMRRKGRHTPSTAYLDWRLETAYGSSNATASGDDLVHYLAWRRQMRRAKT
jgi:hypothetical protein